MAQQALGAGTIGTATSGPCSGCSTRTAGRWASVKAFVWLVIIILHARLPARPRLLLDGRPDGRPRRPRLVADQPLPADERDPAVPGAGRRGRPVAAVARPSCTCPQPRTDGAVIQVGTKLLYIGGSDGTTAQSTVYVAQTVGTGNFDKWAEGPPLPEPRADASVAYVAGSIYVIGGRDAAGAPTTTVFVLTPDSQTGALGEWTTRRRPWRCPRPRSGPRPAITPDGLLLIGGRTPTVRSRRPGRRRSTTRARSASGPRSSRSSRRRPTRRRSLVGDYVWLYGGQRRERPGRPRPARRVRPGGGRGPAREPRRGQGRSSWDVNDAANLPAPATNARGWGANGAIYLAGGDDGSGPQTELYWAVPTDRRATSPNGSTSTSATCPAGARGRAGRRHRPERDPRRWATTADGRRRLERPRQHRAAEPVLPARPRRGDRARPQDRGRDRPAARLPQRGRRRAPSTSSS